MFTDMYPELDNIEVFNKAIRDVLGQLADELVEKNTKYKGAYRKARRFCKDRFGNPGIPYEVHRFEKTLRIDTQNDDENSRLDRLGYELLEYVCWTMDDVVVSGQNASVDKPKVERKRRTRNGKVCLHCGKHLIGHQTKFCSKQCSNTYWNTRRARVDGKRIHMPDDEPDTVERETRRCVVCNEVFMADKGSLDFYCSTSCSATGRHRQRYGWHK